MLDGNYLHILVSPRQSVMLRPMHCNKDAIHLGNFKVLPGQWDSDLVLQNGRVREEINIWFLSWFTLTRYGLDFRSIAWPRGVINNTLLALELWLDTNLKHKPKSYSKYSSQWHWTTNGSFKNTKENLQNVHIELSTSRQPWHAGR